eukprot:TRINITY_DN93815_c0_g1_i1.p1 TRINITY_DN93815_c0_g1~~TRINITY_DN93815_c0_g1_i1.p1  ORF type:complete len:340 (+),score=115.98 TRINITY_DN93815_c0_g1_i1:102-1121(+)
MAVYFYDKNGYWRCEGRRRHGGGGRYFDKFGGDGGEVLKVDELRMNITKLQKELEAMRSVVDELKMKAAEKHDIECQWRWWAEWRLMLIGARGKDEQAEYAKEYCNKVDAKFKGVRALPKHATVSSGDVDRFVGEAGVGEKLEKIERMVAYMADGFTNAVMSHGEAGSVQKGNLKAESVRAKHAAVSSGMAGEFKEEGEGYKYVSKELCSSCSLNLQDPRVQQNGGMDDGDKKGVETDDDAKHDGEDYSKKPNDEKTDGGATDTQKESCDKEGDGLKDMAEYVDEDEGHPVLYPTKEEAREARKKNDELKKTDLVEWRRRREDWVRKRSEEDKKRRTHG